MSQLGAEGATLGSAENDRFAFTVQAGDAATRSHLDRAYAWGAERPHVSIGAAVALTVGASAATALYVRRRARARARRLAWALLAGRMVNSAVPAGFQSDTLRGAGALLLSGLMLARRRGARTHSALDELNERLTSLQSQLETHLPRDRSRFRDLLICAAMALGLFSLIGRLGSSRYTGSAYGAG